MNTKRPEDRPAPTPPSPPYPGYPPPYAYYPSGEKASLLDYWGVLVKYKRFITLFTLACTAAALAAAFLMTPVYRGETLLAPVSDEQSGDLGVLAGQFGGLAALAGVNLRRSGNSTQEAIATLKSRALTDSFIKEQDLLPVLFSDRRDPDTKVWKKKWWDVSDDQPAPTSWDAFKLFDRKVRSVNVGKKTGLVTLAIEWDDPALAAKWANILVQRVNTERREKAIHEAEKSIAYLKQQLAKTSAVEIHQAIYRLIESQTKTIMLANTREEYAFKVIDPAVSPEERIRPKRKLMVTLGFLAGLMVGIFIALLSDNIPSQALNTPEDG